MAVTLEQLIVPHQLEMLVQWVPARPGAAGFISGLDVRSGTLRIMGSGAWNETDADRYFAMQRPIVEVARRRLGPIKAYYDVRDWIVENPQSALQFQQMNNEIYLPEDRVVAVVNTSAGKQHPRTALGAANPAVFLSTHAAETWLQAYAD